MASMKDQVLLQLIIPPGSLMKDVLVIKRSTCVEIVVPKSDLNMASINEMITLILLEVIGIARSESAVTITTGLSTLDEVRVFLSRNHIKWDINPASQ